jgi:hypothetical protein
VRVPIRSDADYENFQTLIQVKAEAARVKGKSAKAKAAK